MNLLRPILVLLVVAVPVWLSGRYAEHHEGEGIFQTLYMHLRPSRLVTGGHGHAEGAAEHAVEGAPEHVPGAPAEAQAPAHAGPEHGATPIFGITLPLPAAIDLDPAREGTQVVLTNLQLFQAAAVLLLFVCFGGVARYVRTGRGDYLTRLFAGFAQWVRDEMVYPIMGQELGRKFLPFFLSLFFFIMFMNLLGLVPGGATATASIFVTGALATITLGSMLICGMAAQGPIGFWKNQVPAVPLVLWPLMFVVELIGLVVKPFALMVRLFANMNGGHMVVLSFMGLIFFFGTMAPAAGYLSAPLAVGFAMFMMIIEAFVAMLQAYIFTQLSIIFVNSSIHPDH